MNIIGPSQIFHSRLQDSSKELIAESQRVKIQLRNLEKQLNDLKLAAQAQGVTHISESDRLTQELQLIEQGIQEKQKEVYLVSYIMFTWFTMVVQISRFVTSLFINDSWHHSFSFVHYSPANIFAISVFQCHNR